MLHGVNIQAAFSVVFQMLHGVNIQAAFSVVFQMLHGVHIPFRLHRHHQRRQAHPATPLPAGV